jgi:hypothetical protein
VGPRVSGAWAPHFATQNVADRPRPPTAVRPLSSTAYSPGPTLSDRGTTTAHSAQTRTYPRHLTWHVSDDPYGRFLDEGTPFVRHRHRDRFPRSVDRGTPPNVVCRSTRDQLRDHLQIDNELRRGVGLGTSNARAACGYRLTTGAILRGQRAATWSPRGCRMPVCQSPRSSESHHRESSVTPGV